MSENRMSDELMRQLEAMHRAPFREALASFLGAQPTEENIRDWAQNRPDRWAQGLSVVARLAGYTDKLEIEGSVQHTVSHMSDAELYQYVEKLRQQAEPIEGEATRKDDDAIPPPQGESDE